MGQSAPQIDLDIINEVLLSEGKKETSPFRLNRLEKAINAAKKTNYQEGLKLEAYYMAYIGQTSESINFLDQNIKKYPSFLQLREAKASISIISGEWNLMKQAFAELIDVLEVNVEWKYRILFFCRLYEDVDFAQTLFPEDDFSKHIAELDKVCKRRFKLNISIGTYRSVLQFMSEVFSESFDGNPHWYVDYDNDGLNIVAYIHGANPMDTATLTNKLNDKILQQNQDFIEQSYNISAYFSIARESEEGGVI